MANMFKLKTYTYPPALRQSMDEGNLSNSPRHKMPYFYTQFFLFLGALSAILLFSVSGAIFF